MQENDPYEVEDENSDEDDLAAMQEAVQAESDERDEAVGEALQTETLKAARLYNDPGPDPGRDGIREELGFDLAWWREDEGTAPLEVVVDLASETCGYVKLVRDLIRAGYPEEAMPAAVTLNSLDGPLVAAGLQVLGTLHPHLREEVTLVLKKLRASVPEPTEAEEEAYATAVRTLDEEELQKLEESGVRVISLDDLLQPKNPDPEIGMN